MAAAGSPWQLECENVEQRCGYLLTSTQWSDCTFVVGSETNQEVVPAHKLVLAMASPVFEAMFYGGLSDSEHNEPIVPIPDVPPEVFRALLQYIYTGNVSIDSSSLACDLWYVAKKYMLPYLVQKCNSYICSVLSPSNVCRTYEFARLFDDKTLTDNCIKIICTNTKEVLKDSSFVDVELKTVITVCSLDHLTVDSELDLFHAVARCAEAEQRRQGQISPPADGGPPSAELSNKVLLPSASASSSPAVELDSKPHTKVERAEPTADKENLKEEEPSIRAALQKIRFLSLSPAQFAEGPARSNLLTKDEVLALFMNIGSKDSSVPMPNGFSECRERRQPRSDWVDKGPFDKLRPAPSTQSRSVAATKLPTPAEIVHGLSSSNEGTLEHAARAARRMTCADANGTSENVAQLIAAGAIPLLVTALQYLRSGVQYDAAAALTNIACDGNHAMVLVNDGAVRALVSVLENGGAVAEPAARALANIAMGGDTARDAVVDAGALSKLQAHMRPSTPSAPLGTYVRTYRMICQKYVLPVKSRFEQLSSVVPYIVDLLHLADEQVLAEACGILHHLADGAAKFKPLLFTHSLVTYHSRGYKQLEVSTRCPTRLTALLGPDAAPRVQTAALAAVGSMLRTTTTALLRDQLLRAGCFEHIIRFLKSGNHSHVKKAAQATAHILLGTPNNIQLALDKGIVDALGPALTEEDDECKLHAVIAVFYICDRGSPEQLRELAASAALEPYCWLLAADSCTCGDVLGGLTNLLKKVDQNTKVDLVVKLREIGVPQLLLNLQQDADGNIVMFANSLLQTYFNNNQ